MWKPKILQICQIFDLIKEPLKQLLDLSGYHGLDLFELLVNDNEFFIGEKANKEILDYYNNNIPKYDFTDCFIDENIIDNECTYQNKPISFEYYGLGILGPINFLYGKTYIILDENTFKNKCKYYKIPLKKILEIYKEIEEILNKFYREMFSDIRYNAIKCLENYKTSTSDGIVEYFTFLLNNSFYTFDWKCFPKIEYNTTNKSIIIDYYLPTIEEIPNVRENLNKKIAFDFRIWKEGDNMEFTHEYSYEKDIKYIPETSLKKLYDEIIYKITLRSIGEIFHFDSKRVVDTIFFNGRIKTKNRANGNDLDSCILSVQVNRNQFEEIDMNFIDAKVCFKYLKGVSATKLYNITPIMPILSINKEDKRFIDSYDVTTHEGTNLATINWEDFEHLVREIFDLEFNVNGGEVKITQSSRDGGVDAIAFDPDPIRGGKIVIQAKRYTNTVGVSSVRDLYGTIINEGANKGILITTSDYGTDSYKFALGKPITLLNGGHLLYLLKKHGRKAHIDINEAKILNKK